MNTPKITAVAEAYLRQWNGCTAKVVQVASVCDRYTNEALVLVREGDAEWALRLSWDPYTETIVVVEDSLSGDDFRKAVQP